MGDSDDTLLRIVRASSHYDVLGVSRQCTLDEAKRAYRRLCLLCHPDKNSSERAKVCFTRVAAAWETISDDTKRRIYDHTGDMNPQSTPIRRRRPRPAEGVPAEALFSAFFGMPFQPQGFPPDVRQHMAPGGAQYHYRHVNMAEELPGVASFIPLLLMLLMLLLVLAVYSSALSPDPPVFSLRFDQTGGYVVSRTTRPEYGNIPYYVKRDFSIGRYSLTAVESHVLQTAQRYYDQQCRVEQQQRYELQHRAATAWSTKTRLDYEEKLRQFKSPNCHKQRRLQSLVSGYS
eukprot:TRINITY_DN20797_c0_g1_i1.p1 TRINITY_DN20797_c0_g1~~TRINITY_DN20797_c0_g1_i1.p1  ORF type:complete len:289 (-),score=21.19 TRINITY_DN20797_c0_g1_i1:653-1519(-)